MAVEQRNPEAFLAQIENLSRSHPEHELFYSQAPLEDAVKLQQVSRTLKALAGHWARVTPASVEHANPYAGCDDLNVQAAIETLGVLFLEGEGEPAEIGRIKRELTTQADDHEQTGAWLGEAMQSTWKTASGLLHIEPLADLLGERHRIIAANWQNASLNVIIGALLRRAAEILEAVNFTPAAIRADLDDKRLTPRYLFAAAELTDRAADLLAEGAVLVHDSERRWRVFHERVETFVIFTLFERPGLGLGHFFYVPVLLLASTRADHGSELRAASSLRRSTRSASSSIRRCRRPRCRTASTGIRFITYVLIGAGFGWFAARNRDSHTRLRLLAERDFLTGIANGRAFDDAVRERLGNGTRFALFIADMDSLKRINTGRAIRRATGRSGQPPARSSLRLVLATRLRASVGMSSRSSRTV